MKIKYSKKQIRKAGKTLINDKATKIDKDNAMDILSSWRIEHHEPLDIAYKILQEVSLKFDSEAVCSKRLKRADSIIQKLKRFEKMNLDTMQDIGGCRAVFSDKKKLHKALVLLKKEYKKEFKSSKNNYKIKNYIKKPKEDGYRSYHIIGNFLNKKIEIQLRTKIQHYWATSLEIVDIFTSQALKSNHGDKDWEDFFKKIGEQFSIIEDIININQKIKKRLKEYHKQLNKNEELKKKALETKKLAKKIGVRTKLNSFSYIINDFLENEDIKVNGYLLLKIKISSSKLKLNFKTFNNIEQAEVEYIEEEKLKKENTIVVLLSSNSIKDMKKAYPNFWADSKEFLRYLTFILLIDEKF